MNLLFGGIVLAAVMIGGDPVSDRAEESMRDALALIEAGDRQAGMTALEKSITAYPAYLPAYIEFGRALLPSEPDRARLFAREVLRIDPDDGSALDLLTRSYEMARALGTDIAGETRLRALEIADYEFVLRTRPDNPELLYRIASQRLALERLLPARDIEAKRKLLDAAVAELAHLREVLGEEAESHLRSAAHFQSGRAIKHVGDFERSGGRDPARDYAEAIDQFEATLALEPDRIDALGEIVLIHQVVGASELAIKAVTAHIEHVQAPASRAKILSVLGNLEIETGAFVSATEHLEQALEINPNTVDAYLGLYRIAKSQSDAPAVIAVLERAIAADARFLLAYLLSGQEYIAAKRYDEAIAAFESVLRVAPAEATVLGMMPSKNLYRNRLYYDAASRLAWLYLRHSQDPTRALEMVQRAQTFSDPDPYLMDTMASAYIENGDAARAVELLTTVLEQNDAIASAHYHLAQARLALGDEDAARHSLDAALDLEQSFFQRDDARALRDTLNTSP